MPKNKKQASSSDSDEGPVDRNQPAEKKARTEDGEPSWVLGGKKFLKVREFKGKTYVDIREFYEKDGNLLPGKKGISLTPELWRKLVSVAEEVNDAISKK